MKKHLAIIPILLFTLMFSSTSYAEWTKVSEGVDGDNYYVNFDWIRKHGGYVYYWYLTDYLKPDKYGDLSSKIYTQGDCKRLRVKALSYSFHNEPMGGGTAEIIEPKEDNTNWKYPPPKSSMETMLKSVCDK